MAGVSIAVLQSLPIFASMPMAQMEALGRLASLRQASRGSVVVREGEDTGGVYFILNGTLKVFVSDTEGREVILTILGRGVKVHTNALVEGCIIMDNCDIGRYARVQRALFNQ